MRPFVGSARLALALLVAPEVAAAKRDPLCSALRAFVAAVPRHETHELDFHTSWGRGFKDDLGPESMSAKRCDDGDYAPAKAVCALLMQYGHIEFSNEDAQAAISCLSPGTRFAPSMELLNGKFRLGYGTPDRGSSVTVEFREDSGLGGMVLGIEASGY